MTKKDNSTETVSVRVKADANTDFVRCFGVDIGKDEFIDVDASIKTHELFSLLELSTTK